MYREKRGRSGQVPPVSSHSTRRSNCSAASNSAFMAAAHSSSSDFWGKKNGGQVSGGGSCWPEHLYPYPAGATFPQNCQSRAPARCVQVTTEGPCLALTRISGTFFFFRFSFTTGGEIPGRVVSGTQGIAGTLGTSVNFEHPKGETPARSSAASSPWKPKQDWRPGVEVEAQARLSSRL